MTRILTYKDIDRAQWSALVNASSTGTWFQSPEAYDFLAAQQSVMQAFAYALSDTRGVLKGVCVGYVTREKNALRQLLTRRAIIPGGACLADDSSDEQVTALMRAVQERLCRQVIYIETRNFNDYSRWRVAFAAAGFAYRPHLNFHVQPDDFEQRLSDNRKRQLHKIESQQPRLAIREARNIDEISAWYGILSELYRSKVKTPLFPDTFFLNAYRTHVARFLLVICDDTIIGGSMLAADERCVYEWYECGLNSRYKEQYPSVAATLAGIRYAQENDCTRYDMMGAGEPGVPYGVRDFKAEFGGEQVEHGRFLHITHPLLYRLGAWGVKVLRTDRR